MEDHSEYRSDLRLLWKRKLAFSFKCIALAAIAFCSAQVGTAQTPSLSADDTVTYINTTLHKYPTLEFVDSGCPGYEQVVAISTDRRSLVITQNFGKSKEGRCDTSQTLTAPIFNLNRDGLGSWSKQGQHSSFFLDCVQRVNCFTRQSDQRSFAFAENNWYLQLTAPDQISDQLSTALKHLHQALLDEANARIDTSDPFAKRAH